MKMSEILRGLADLIDQKQQGDQGADMRQLSTQQRMTQSHPTEPELDPDPIMVPPLQAKLEILKKSEGIPNVYDQGESDNDELAVIKKNAGLTAAQHEASEDNDVLG
jgi:hypothetical protein